MRRHIIEDGTVCTDTYVHNIHPLSPSVSALSLGYTNTHLTPDDHIQWRSTSPVVLLDTG
jgi:hypothetical protein